MGSKFIENRAGAIRAKGLLGQNVRSGFVPDQDAVVVGYSRVRGSVKLEIEGSGVVSVSGQNFARANFPDQFPPEPATSGTSHTKSYTTIDPSINRTGDPMNSFNSNPGCLFAVFNSADHSTTHRLHENSDSDMGRGMEDA